MLPPAISPLPAQQALPVEHMIRIHHPSQRARLAFLTSSPHLPPMDRAADMAIARVTVLRTGSVNVRMRVFAPRACGCG
jgi:hypothetical protein